jgi:hypothetical protein
MVGEMYLHLEFFRSSKVMLTVVMSSVELSLAKAQRISNHFPSVAVYYDPGESNIVLVGGHQPEDSFKELFPQGGFSCKHIVGDEFLPFELPGHLVMPEGSQKVDFTPWGRVQRA